MQRVSCPGPPHLRVSPLWGHPLNGNVELAELLAPIVSGDLSAVASLGRFMPQAVGDCAERHGVLPLLTQRLATAADSPLPLREHLQARANREVVRDLVREGELRALLDGLHARGVRALLFKGAHLAYLWYERPDLRPRLDTDLLVATTERRAADEALIDLGYTRPPLVSGELISHQAAYIKYRDGARAHIVDLHWRVVNPHVFSTLWTFEELAESSVPLPPLGPTARGPSHTFALLLACIHRVAHHFDSERLIWLVDIHRLASAATAEEWQAVEEQARRRGVAAVVARSLERTIERFGTVVPEGIVDRLRQHAEHHGEVTAEFLAPDRKRLDDLVSDMRALGTWSDRSRLIREHLFPSARYMREVYAPGSRSLLPLLYARRVISGMGKWLYRRSA